MVIALALLTVGFAMAASMCPFDPADAPEGAAMTSVSAGYEVAGTLSSGSVSMDLQVSNEKIGDLYGTDVYTSSLFGKGQIQFVSDTSMTGGQITGSQAAMLGGGRLVGSSGAYTMSCTPNANLSDVNATVVPFCSRVEVLNSYDISQGQAGSQTMISTPGTMVSQEFAMTGNGLASFEGSYKLTQGFGVKVDAFKAKTTMIGTGLEFAGKFEYIG